MLFTTLPFLLFFLLLYLLYWMKEWSVEKRKYMLIVASFIFYGWWSIPFLVHFVTFVALNYLIYLFVDRPSRRQMQLLVVFNLLHLAFFKYFYLILDLPGFLLQGEASSQISIGFIPEVILPLAISFYTFQVIAYHVDRYRGNIEYSVSAGDFVLFIMFFPQLIAGPILRHDQLLPALSTPVVLRKNWLDKGIFLVLIGVIKKAILADQVEPIIAPVFLNPEQYDSISIMLALYGFAIQIYMDFSGYTDIARGLAYALGYKIPQNFRAPYFAAGFREFWQRWHITLSQWLRDYLYIPLGGNRISRVRTSVNLLITMLLGGLWHGASVTFLVWGALHGLFLFVERFLVMREGRSWWRWLRVAVVFQVVVLAWAFFRAPTMEIALALLGGIFVNGGDMHLTLSSGAAMIALAALVLHVYEFRPRWFLSVWRGRAWILPAATVILGFLLMSLSGDSLPFIYYVF